MSTIIESIESRALRRVPQFAAGDRVRVHFQVVEGTRRRTQVFEGIVISRSGSGARETFIVRKQSFGVGVERTFPLHSPKIERLEVVARGAVRRAKLYYLRGRVGKRARVAERRWGIEDDVVIAEPEESPVDSEGVAQEDAEVEVVESEEETEEASADQADEPAAAAAEETSEEPKAEEAETEPEAEAEPDAEAEAEPEAEAETKAEGGADEGEEPARAEADEAGT